MWKNLAGLHKKLDEINESNQGKEVEVTGSLEEVLSAVTNKRPSEKILIVVGEWSLEGMEDREIGYGVDKPRFYSMSEGDFDELPSECDHMEVQICTGN